ncbi:hypothetical protein VXQ18_02690 [Brucella abortus]|nr:hypothetical protein [Brucella abortus]
MRIVDAAQYQARVNDFDYDVITAVIAQNSSPGNEQRDMWGPRQPISKAAATMPASESGHRQAYRPCRLCQATTRSWRRQLHALDRAPLWNYYVIPQWYSDHINVAYWNKFGMPEKLARLSWD